MSRVPATRTHLPPQIQPGAAGLVRVQGVHVLLRHRPLSQPRGFDWLLPGEEGMDPTDHAVVEVREDNPDRLADRQT
jgi:hypothetical protein